MAEKEGPLALDAASITSGELQVQPETMRHRSTTEEDIPCK